MAWWARRTGGDREEQQTQTEEVGDEEKKRRVEDGPQAEGVKGVGLTWLKVKAVGAFSKKSTST